MNKTQIDVMENFESEIFNTKLFADNKQHDVLVFIFDPKYSSLQVDKNEFYNAIVAPEWLSLEKVAGHVFNRKGIIDFIDPSFPLLLTEGYSDALNKNSKRQWREFQKIIADETQYISFEDLYKKVNSMFSALLKNGRNNKIINR